MINQIVQQTTNVLVDDLRREGVRITTGIIGVLNIRLHEALILATLQGKTDALTLVWETLNKKYPKKKTDP